MIYKISERALSKGYSVDAVKGQFGDIKEYSDILARGLQNNFVFPIRFKVYSGTSHQDLLNTGTGSFNLVSTRLVQILEDCQTTGAQFFEVEVTGKKGEIIEGYKGLSVTGRAGFVDYSKGVREEGWENESKSFIHVKGIYPDMDEWDGSDIFLPKDNRGKFISERLYKILAKQKLKNVWLYPASEAGGYIKLAHLKIPPRNMDDWLKVQMISNRTP